MAAKIKIDAEKVVKDLHEDVVDLIKSKLSALKDVKIENSIVLDPNADELEILILSTSSSAKNDCKTFMENYLSMMFGENVAKTFKDSDLKLNGSHNLFELNTKSGKEPKNPDLDDVLTFDDIDGSNDEEAKPKKNGFNLFSELKALMADGLAVLRSIKVKGLSREEPWPIGKWLFGTSHDVQDSKLNIEKAMAKEFPSNSISYEVFKSESVYNILFVRKANGSDLPWLNQKNDSSIYRKLMKSKYTFIAKVFEDTERNYESIDEDAFRSMFSEAIGFSPDRDGIKKISGYRTNIKNSNKRAKDFEKIGKSKIDKKMDAILDEFTKLKMEIQKNDSLSDTEKNDSIEDIKIDFMQLFLKAFDELNPDADKSDRESYLREFKSQLNGDDVYGEKCDLYIIPLTTDSLFKKIRNSFDDLDGKSSQNYGNS